MDIQAILKTVDHTLLRPEATWPQIKALCDEGVRYGVATVCVPPAHVANAAQYLNGNLPVCTVIGFPNGYSTTYMKCLEAQDARQNGAEEIDMVINLGWAKNGRMEWVGEEIKAVKGICGEHVLKVIIETCLLTEEEKLQLCEVVSSSGADFIKTSTGFGGGGATFEDVALLKAHIRPGLKLKASGGITSLEDAERFLSLGADRLGTSRVVRAVQELEAQKTAKEKSKT